MKQIYYMLVVSYTRVHIYKKSILEHSLLKYWTVEMYEVEVESFNVYCKLYDTM